MNGKLPTYLLMALLVLPSSSSCKGAKKRKRYRSARVELPLGYQHVGVKTVFVRPADPASYNCQLAVKAMQFEIRKYEGLFSPVDDAEAAEVEFVVHGEQGVGTKSGGAGVVIGPPSWPVAARGTSRRRSCA